MSNDIKTKNELTIEKSLRNSILEWFEFIFKIGLVVGSLIAFCFYFFYVGIMPSIGSLGDATILIIIIACIGSLLVAIFTCMFLPTLFFNNQEYIEFLKKDIILWDWIVKIKEKNKVDNLILNIDVIKIFFLLVAIFNIIMIYIFLHLNDQINQWISSIVIILILFIFIIYIVNSLNIMGIIILSIFITILIVIIIYILKNIDKEYFTWIIIVFSILPFLITFKIKVLLTQSSLLLLHSFVMTLYSFFLFTNSSKSIVLILFSICFIIFFNIVVLNAIKDKFKLEDEQKTQQDKFFYQWFPIVSIIFLVLILSFVWLNFHIDNIFITKPFQMLRLGYYKATLQFKEDFIQKNNPFELNKNNCEEGNFFIRSSLGDEYILEELGKHEEYEKNEKNKENITVYRIKKEFVVSETKTDNKMEYWRKNCNSYEKITFQKEFIKKNNPFPENKKDCLTKVFWVQDKGTTLELKDSNDGGQEPYQILSSYIVSRQKVDVKEANKTWLDCQTKKNNTNISPSIVYQIKCETK